MWVFLILCIASATINAGAVAIVTAAIVKMAIPSLTFDAGMVSVMIMVSCLLILASGRYKALDNVSKIIIVSLTIATVAAAAVAMSRGMQMKPDFIEPTPWTLAGLGFLIALMAGCLRRLRFPPSTLCGLPKNNASTLPATATVFSTSRRLHHQRDFGGRFPRLGVHMSNTATAKKCKWRAANMSAS